jgi:hypothetical protein
MAVSFSHLQQGKPYHVGAQDANRGAACGRSLQNWMSIARRTAMFLSAAA